MSNALASPQAVDLTTLTAWDHDHVWHPFTDQADWLASEPLFIDRAEGVFLIDLAGRRYIDGVSSLWCNLLGHRHPALDAALRGQLDRIAHSTLLGLTHEPAVRLARRLAELAPPGLTRVFFSDSGATAVEVALKLAFQYWRQKNPPEPQRRLFLALDGAYHGDTLGDVSLGGVPRFHAMFGPLLFPTLRAPSPSAQNPTESLQTIDRLLREHPGQVAAVVLEPIVQCAAGIRVHPDGFLAQLAQLVRQHNTLLILDEVAVGMGRTGTLFACQREGVSPDFLCLAKGLTGGYLPLAATLTTDAIHAAFTRPHAATPDPTFYHGHTYCGNPLGAAVALATLDTLLREHILERLPPRIDQLRRWLDRLRSHPHVAEARQAGLIAGIELVRDRSTRTPFDPSLRLGARVCLRARHYGAILRPLGDVLVLMPPLVISEAELEQLCSALEHALHDELEALP
ncbi:MAG: adenosylmethionine-8-amino-7-oxononanoate aminotransferase [Isosphaeraceae bacterium]|nr:MAG: adenosylmethionine-8-amino-7-oxononanoate aminotransferase [Isosphaeraceae bacterium]